MKIELKKRPKKVTIIEGFPGFGLVGTISTEFLLEHLNAEQIGKITVEEIPPVVAVHQGNVVEPIGIFYNKKYNLVILHALTSITGLEWKLAEIITNLSKELEAKEIISIEGVGNLSAGGKEIFYLSTKDKKLSKLGLKELREGIIVGVTGALILNKKLNHSCLFAETASNLPDSRAAAGIIEVLDKYLGLKVDYKPLIKKAESFEKKIKTIFEGKNKMSNTKKEKEISYLG